MTSTARNTFVRQQGARKIDLDKLDASRAAQDALAKGGVSATDLRRADTNRDGKLDANEAFNVADRFDTDGDADTLLRRDRAGVTRAGKALDALGAALQDPAVSSATRSASRRQFVRSHQRQRASLDALAGNQAAQKNLGAAGLSIADLKAADTNGDGRLSAREAFRLADRRDDDGNSRTIAHAVDGKKTAAGEALDALGELLATRGRATGQTIADVARYRVATFGRNYGVDGEWKSPNPRHAGNLRPDRRRVGNGVVGRWKCNLFGLDVVYQAGFQVPLVNGYYPCATSIPSYSRGPRRYFDRVVEISFAGMSLAERRAKVRELMKKARPGDVVILDHAGPAGSDGGHTRVVVENNTAKDGTIKTAEARQESARLIDHDVDSFGRVHDGEEKMVLLRPRRRR